MVESSEGDAVYATLLQKLDAKIKARDPDEGSIALLEMLLNLAAERETSVHCLSTALAKLKIHVTLGHLRHSEPDWQACLVSAELLQYSSSANMAACGPLYERFRSALRTAAATQQTRAEQRKALVRKHGAEGTLATMRSAVSCLAAIWALHFRQRSPSCRLESLGLDAELASTSWLYTKASMRSSGDSHWTPLVKWLDQKLAALEEAKARRRHTGDAVQNSEPSIGDWREATPMRSQCSVDQVLTADEEGIVPETASAPEDVCDADDLAARVPSPPPNLPADCAQSKNSGGHPEQECSLLEATGPVGLQIVASTDLSCADQSYSQKRVSPEPWGLPLDGQPPDSLDLWAHNAAEPTLSMEQAQGFHCEVGFTVTETPSVDECEPAEMTATGDWQMGMVPVPPPATGAGTVPETNPELMTGSSLGMASQGRGGCRGESQPTPEGLRKSQADTEMEMAGAEWPDAELHLRLHLIASGEVSRSPAAPAARQGERSRPASHLLPISSPERQQTAGAPNRQEGAQQTAQNIVLDSAPSGDEDLLTPSALQVLASTSGAALARAGAQPTSNTRIQSPRGGQAPHGLVCSSILAGRAPGSAGATKGVVALRTHTQLTPSFRQPTNRRLATGDIPNGQSPSRAIQRQQRQPQSTAEGAPVQQSSRRVQFQVPSASAQPQAPAGLAAAQGRSRFAPLQFRRSDDGQPVPVRAAARQAAVRGPPRSRAAAGQGMDDGRRTGNCRPAGLPPALARMDAVEASARPPEKQDTAGGGETGPPPAHGEVYNAAGQADAPLPVSAAAGVGMQPPRLQVDQQASMGTAAVGEEAEGRGFRRTRAVGAHRERESQGERPPAIEVVENVALAEAGEDTAAASAAFGWLGLEGKSGARPRAVREAQPTANVPVKKFKDVVSSAVEKVKQGLQVARLPLIVPKSYRYQHMRAHQVLRCAKAAGKPRAAGQEDTNYLSAQSSPSHGLQPVEAQPTSQAAPEQQADGVARGGANGPGFGEGRGSVEELLVDPNARVSEEELGGKPLASIKRPAEELPRGAKHRRTEKAPETPELTNQLDEDPLSEMAVNQSGSQRMVLIGQPPVACNPSEAGLPSETSPADFQNSLLWVQPVVPQTQPPVIDSPPEAFQAHSKSLCPPWTGV